MAIRRKMMFGIGLALLATSVIGDTVYVSPELQFGLHADKLNTSPILKLVPSGTALKLIRTEDRSSLVRMVDGTEGWMDNSYLANTPAPAPANTAAPVVTDVPATSDAPSIEQQLKSERVRTGELQVQIAELRKRLGQDGSNDSLYEKIDQLAMEKKDLEIQLAQILEGDVPAAPGLSASPGPDGFFNLRNFIIAFAVALVAGVIAGLYLMDFRYRRRHGGFRV